MENHQAIKHNKGIEKMFEKQIKADTWSWYGFLFHFKCVECSGYCSLNNFLFAGKNINKVKCWDCQKNEN